METARFDSAWKDIVEALFFPFLDFYFPALAAETDHGVAPASRDKELQKLVSGNRSGNRYADMLFEVVLTGGGKRTILLHIEVQGAKEKQFDRRLFQYAYRIMDREGRFPSTLVLLTDTDPSFFPSGYTENLGGGALLRVDYHVFKLLYLKEKAEELRNSRNPFAFVSAAHLAAMGKRGNRAAYAAKLQLTRELVVWGFSGREIFHLLRFLDWILQLPPELEELYDRQAKELLGEERMPYITSWERFAEKRGLEQGIEQGLEQGALRSRQETLERLLRKKFGITAQEERTIEACGDPAALDSALDSVLDAGTKEEVLHLLGRRDV